MIRSSSFGFGALASSAQWRLPQVLPVVKRHPSVLRYVPQAGSRLRDPHVMQIGSPFVIRPLALVDRFCTAVKGHVDMGGHGSMFRSLYR